MFTPLVADLVCQVDVAAADFVRWRVPATSSPGFDDGWPETATARAGPLAAPRVVGHVHYVAGNGHDPLLRPT
jgi:hypothetical protein